MAAGSAVRVPELLWGHPLSCHIVLYKSHRNSDDSPPGCGCWQKAANAFISAVLSTRKALKASTTPALWAQKGQ